MKNNTSISLRNITVSYDNVRILKDFSLDIGDGEFITFLGPSGCGKTTILKVIAGFLQPDEGEVIFYGKNINSIPPHKRSVNTVFQKYALFPHMNVFENIAFGMRIQKKSKAEINENVMSLLKLVNLDGFEKRNINSLSGGQQQRVAIARALAVKPKILLFDEPLAALDLQLRKDMQSELKKLQRQTGITFIFVTHDQEEALSMSDRVVVIDNGIIQQIGTPEDIYNEPANAFVADFIGESNIIDGVMLDDCLVHFSDITFKCVDRGFEKNQAVDVVIRPEDIKLCEPSEKTLNGTVSYVVFKGIHYEMIVDVDGFKWMLQSTQQRKVGQKIGMELSPDDIHVMPKSNYSDTIGDYSAFSDEFYDEKHKEDDNEN